MALSEELQKSCRVTCENEPAEEFDVFGSNFSTRTEDKITNPFNLKNILDFCEDLTSDGGVKKSLIKRGDGPVVTKDANVTIKYVAFTEFGEGPIFHVKRPLNTDIGIITLRGLRIALSSMKKGEKSNFYFTPEYAFGKLGCPPNIPPNSACIYVVEMIDFEEMAGAGEYFDMPFGERLDADFEVFVSVIKMRMKQAKEYFSRENYGKALSIYTSMVQKLRNNYVNMKGEEEWTKHLVSLSSNAALCSLKLDDFEACIKFADWVLTYDPKHVKALYAKGKAYNRLGNTSEALKYLTEAKKISPKNKDINQELQYLDVCVGRANKSEKELFLKMNRNLRDEIETKVKVKDEINVDGLLCKEVSDEFKKFSSDMKNSSDPSEEMVISTDLFSIEELEALAYLAETYLLKVSWKKLDGRDAIRITKT